jgi:hypothetical protein
MRAEDETLIRVQRDWDGWRTGEVRLGDLKNVHWLQPSRAPRPLVHGYISCTSIVTGDIPHDCALSEGPHRLLVCALKNHLVPSAYAELARRADIAALHDNSLANRVENNLGRIVQIELLHQIGSVRLDR